MTTSYLYITEKANYDQTNHKAIDVNLISKTMFDAGSMVKIESGDDEEVVVEIEIEKFNKDEHILIMNNKKYKVLNIVSKGDGINHSAPVQKTPIVDMSSLKAYDDFADLKPIAKELIEKNGKTSSLEVKEELRKRGFFAKQNMVSDSLQQVALHSNGEIDLRYNGKFNEYYFTKSIAPTAPMQSSAVSQTTAAKKPRAKRNSLVVDPMWNLDLNSPFVTKDEAIDEIKDAIKNHQLRIPAGNLIDTQKIWVVYSPKRRILNLYDGDLTSDNVRGAFGKIMKKQFGDLFQTTRACRLRNIKNWTMS